MVGADESVMVGGNQAVEVGAGQSLRVGTDRTVQVGGAAAEVVGAAKTLTVAGASTVAVGAMLIETVGKTSTERVGGMKLVVAKAAIELQSGATLLRLQPGSAVAPDVAMPEATLSVEADASDPATARLELVFGKAKLILHASGKVTVEGCAFEFAGETVSPGGFATAPGWKPAPPSRLGEALVANDFGGGQ
ncbi:MAG: hypothetical protein JNK04_23075 [Myxococcales bacterium]|nr:hypothetical protein [Myxococcales bacterium]